MLSILIPTYNYNIIKLVAELHHQAMDACVDFEIVVMDDGSVKFKSENKKINSLSFCRFIELPENVGRSKIRNLLADEAKYEYLIFLDCDAEINHTNFIDRYLALCKGLVVAVGGRVYDDNNNNPDFSLTLKYGRKRESHLASLKEMQVRQKTFTTPNFLISKSIFQQIRFDETIKGYGHEDTIFGVLLHQQDIEILFIDNPVVHVGLDNNKIFLRKTEEGIANLYALYRGKKYPYLEKDSKILSTFIQFKSFYLHFPIKWFYLLSKPFLVQNLLSSEPSLVVFDLYKLGYLCEIAIDGDKMA